MPMISNDLQTGRRNERWSPETQGGTAWEAEYAYSLCSSRFEGIVGHCKVLVNQSYTKLLSRRSGVRIPVGVPLKR